MSQKINEKHKDVYVDISLHGGELNDLIAFLNRVVVEPGNTLGQSKSLVNLSIKIEKAIEKHNSEFEKINGKVN